MFPRSVVLIRWLLGLQYLVDGLNFWYKMLPFPNIHDPSDAPMKAAVVGAMITTGWMFHLAKAIEVLTGLALLLNRFVPLALVVSACVAVSTFLLDAFIGHTLVDWWNGRVAFAVAWAAFLDMLYFGGALLLMQVYLMLSYLHVYRPMLAARVEPRLP
jgi:uncharacterized membrane protein YphA (DoxX/SURF4 family)